MSTARRGGVDNIILLSGGGPGTDPEVLAGTVDPSASGVPAAEGSTFLRYGAGAGQSWLKTGAADTAWTMLATATGDVSAVTEKWTLQNVQDSITTVLNGMVSTSFDDINAIRGGSIRGISARFTGALTGGSAILTPTVDGTLVTNLSVTVSSGSTDNEATQAAGLDTFSAGEKIGIKVTTDAGYLPISPALDLEAWLDVSY